MLYLDDKLDIYRQLGSHLQHINGCKLRQNLVLVVQQQVA